MDVKLTEEGLRAAEQSVSSDETFTSLGQEEQATLAGLLDKIIADLD